MPPYVTGSNSDFLKALDPHHGGVNITPRHAFFTTHSPQHGGITTTLDQRPYGGHAINNSVKENNPKVDNKYTIPTLLIGGAVVVYLLTQKK
jgi:hypothetical protein